MNYDCAVDILGATTTTTLGRDGTIVLTDGTKTTTVNTDGFNGKVYHTEQNLLAANCYPSMMVGFATT